MIHGENALLSTGEFLATNVQEATWRIKEQHFDPLNSERHGGLLTYSG